jgi:hypothetical protein
MESETHIGLQSIPAKRATVLVFDNACLEDVLLLLQVHRLRHPRKRIFRFVEHTGPRNALAFNYGVQAVGVAFTLFAPNLPASRSEASWSDHPSR